MAYPSSLALGEMANPRKTRIARFSRRNGKMYLWFRLGELQSAVVSPRVLEVARSFIVPDQLPLWQVTSAFNAMASWGLYFLSGYYYKYSKVGVQIPETTLRYTFLWLPLVMNIFTIYALFCYRLHYSPNHYLYFESAAATREAVSLVVGAIRHPD
jgi:hypothetical protein